MKVHARLLLLVLVALACPAGPQARAQQHRILPVEDWTYTYIQRLQRRGHLLDLHPTALPYRSGEVLAALHAVDRDRLGRVEARWVDLLLAELDAPAPEAGAVHLGGAIEAGLRAADTDRLDVLRPLDSGSAPLSLGAVRLFPNVAARLYAEKDRLIAALGLQHDLYYDVDPDGLDAARRLYVRSENAYLSYDSPLLTATLGRFSNHWGLHGQTATLVSANPRSYDQLNLRIGGRRLALYTLVGELDSVTEDGRFTGRVSDDTVRVGSRRRYLSAHRLDWRPSRYFNLSFQEAALYSGRNANFSLRYLNPLHSIAFELDNTPKNDENNGLLAGLLWLHFRGLTLQGQLLLDDLDVMRSSGEPGSFALSGVLLYAGPLPAVDLGLSAELVTARAYNTHPPEGKYLYLLRGLATQFNDYVRAAAFADLYPARLPGLMLTPRLDVLWQGEQDIRAPYPPLGAPVDLLLDGTPERTVRASVQAYYQRSPHWWIGLDYGANFVANEGFEAGRSRTRFVGHLAFGVRLSLDRAYRLDF